MPIGRASDTQTPENCMTDTDWLNIDAAPPKRKPRKKREVQVESVTKLPGEHSRARVMVKKLTGTSRMWACDGEYVYFRPTRVIGGTKTIVANPTTFARHQRFLDEGQYTHVETQDDVEIFKLSPDSPFARKGQFLGEMKDHEVRRAVVVAACARDWPLYVDCLEELAGRIKSRYDSNTAAAVYSDYLNYIGIMVSQRGGPTDGECQAGLANIRQRRGVGKGKLILLPQGRAA